MENARPHIQAEPSAPDSVHSTKPKRFTPRQERVMRALLHSNGWLSREAIDRIGRASNGPQIILETRARVTGKDGLAMRQVEAKDADGRACKPGEYRLTDVGRVRVERVIAEEALASNGGPNGKRTQ